MTTETLSELIRDRIAGEGPIRFDEFMAMALYHPDLGYYAARVPGPTGDFRTSPTISPRFGEALATLLNGMWIELGEPDSFTVFEPGPGNADLAAQVASCAEGAFAKALTWHFIEPFERVSAIQQRRRDLPPNSKWSKRLDDVQSSPGCVLANEVLDNFPVRLMQVESPQSLSETFVDTSGSDFVEVTVPVTNPSPQALRTAGLLAPGDRFEISQGVSKWCAEAAGALTAGYLLVIDYGDEQPAIWTEHPSGTLMTYGGAATASPLDDPGSLDITAQVDFTALPQAAEAGGFSVSPPLKQREMLLGLGWDKQSPEGSIYEEVSALSPADALSTLAKRSKASLLTAPSGLGGLLAFLATKGCRPLAPWS